MRKRSVSWHSCRLLVQAILFTLAIGLAQARTGADSSQSRTKASQYIAFAAPSDVPKGWTSFTNAVGVRVVGWNPKIRLLNDSKIKTLKTQSANWPSGVPTGLHNSMVEVDGDVLSIYAPVEQNEMYDVTVHMMEPGDGADVAGNADSAPDAAISNRHVHVAIDRELVGTNINVGKTYIKGVPKTFTYRVQSVDTQLNILVMKAAYSGTGPVLSAFQIVKATGSSAPTDKSGEITASPIKPSENTNADAGGETDEKTPAAPVEAAEKPAAPTPPTTKPMATKAKAGDLVFDPPSLVFDDVNPALRGESSRVLAINAKKKTQITSVQVVNMAVNTSTTAGGGDSVPFTFETDDGFIFAGGNGEVQQLETPLAVGPETYTFLSSEFVPNVMGEWHVLVVLMNDKSVLGSVSVKGRGSTDLAGDHTLHVVIQGPDNCIDWDGDGKQVCRFDTAASHTHDPDRSEKQYKWAYKGKQLGGSVVKKIAVKFATGREQITSTLVDNAGDSLTDSKLFWVDDPTAVHAAYKLVYANTTDLDKLPDKATYATYGPEVAVTGNVPFTENFVVKITCQIQVPKGAVDLKVVGGTDRKLVVGDDVVPGAAGSVDVSGKQITLLAVVEDPTVDLPVQLLMNNAPITKRTTFNINTVQPVISTMYPEDGAATGGDLITLQGLAWNPLESQVYIDDKPVAASKIKTVEEDVIRFITPPGPPDGGPVSITVRSLDRSSNPLTFTYLPAAQVLPPVQFESNSIPSPKLARITWCFGNLFTSTPYEGELHRWDVSEDGSAKIVQTSTAVKTGASKNMTSILGLACDPWGSDEDFKLWVSISHLFSYKLGKSGSALPAGLSVPYLGAVGYLKSSEAFAKLHIVIDNLPVSGHDHGVNGLEFLNDGTLLFNIGGQTNAGWPYFKLGGLKEAYFSSAINAAKVKSKGFNGIMKYGWQAGTPASVRSQGDPNDMVWAEWTQPVEGDAYVYASGLRNPFGIHLRLDGKLFGSDNGPNSNFGGMVKGFQEESDGLYPILVGNEQGQGVATMDEFNLIEEGAYYGHPNPCRARAQNDPRQWDYKSGYEGSTADYSAPLVMLMSSSDGVTSFRSEAFGGQLKNHMFVQKYKQYMYRIFQDSLGKWVALTDMQETGRVVTPGLDVVIVPGSMLISSDTQGYLRINKPVDASVENGVPQLWQMDPWRAPKTPVDTITGIISGANLGALGDGVVVTIGGVDVEADKVTDNRIYFKIPALESAGYKNITVGGVDRSLTLVEHYIALADL